jgi:hypothetical protein
MGEKMKFLVFEIITENLAQAVTKAEAYSSISAIIEKGPHEYGLKIYLCFVYPWDARAWFTRKD